MRCPACDRDSVRGHCDNTRCGVLVCRECKAMWTTDGRHAHDPATKAPPPAWQAQLKKGGA